MPGRCGRDGTSIEVLADRLGDEGRSIAASHGGVELLAELVVEGDGDADSHVSDITNDTVPSTITDQIGVSSGRRAYVLTWPGPASPWVGSAKRPESAVRLGRSREGGQDVSVKKVVVTLPGELYEPAERARKIEDRTRSDPGSLAYSLR